MGLQVIEINAAQARSGKAIMALIGEATQSHRIRVAEAPASAEPVAKKPTAKEARKPGRKVRAARAPRALLTVRPAQRGRRRKEVVDSEEEVRPLRRSARLSRFNHHPQADEPEEPKRAEPGRAAVLCSSILLFEEVDVVFDEDAGLHRQIRALMRTTKRPIVLTCNGACKRASCVARAHRSFNTVRSRARGAGGRDAAGLQRGRVLGGDRSAALSHRFCRGGSRGVGPSSAVTLAAQCGVGALTGLARLESVRDLFMLFGYDVRRTLLAMQLALAPSAASLHAVLESDTAPLEQPLSDGSSLTLQYFGLSSWGGRVAELFKAAAAPAPVDALSSEGPRPALQVVEAPPRAVDAEDGQLLLAHSSEVGVDLTHHNYLALVAAYTGPPSDQRDTVGVAALDAMAELAESEAMADTVEARAARDPNRCAVGVAAPALALTTLTNVSRRLLLARWCCSTAARTRARSASAASAAPAGRTNAVRSLGPSSSWLRSAAPLCIWRTHA